MNNAEQFFFDNAGFAYNPQNETREQARERTAKELAAAEVWAVTNGYSFSACDDWEEPGHYVVVMYGDNGKPVSSMGGIDIDSSAYLRVVRAELALDQYKAFSRR